MVEDLIEGNNGLVRAAHIKMSNSRTTRPIVKLYLLEILSDENEGPQIPQSTPNSLENCQRGNRRNHIP